MADYDRRLQRLEELAASTTDRPYVSLEMCRKRTEELLASKEVQACMREHPEPEMSADDGRLCGRRFKLPSKRPSRTAEVPRLAGMTATDP